MSVASSIANAATLRSRRIPPLQPGDRLSRAEFERRFDATLNLKKAELIDGIVILPPPVSNEGHSTPHLDLSCIIATYRASTPGVSAGGNGSLRLDLESMPQPDVFLRVLESHGGQSRVDADDYVDGAPELVAEISATSASYDLHDKMRVYERHGVGEYIVWRVFDRAIDYFVLREGEYVRLKARRGKVYQSEIFPGLWVDAGSLIAGNLGKALNVLKRGLDTKEHGAFVKRMRLAGRRSRR